MSAVSDYLARSGCEPCVGCRQPRNPTVGDVPCPTCGAVRWTLAVTGSRTLTDVDQVRAAARSALAELVEHFGCNPRLTLHGNARGVDRILAAALHRARWPVQAVPADWDTHGRKAGVLRDLSMVARAVALLAVWDGTSDRTNHTISFARGRRLTIATRIINRHRDSGDQEPNEPRRTRHHPHAPRQTPAMRDGRQPTTTGRALPGTMACLDQTRAHAIRPQEGCRARAAAPGSGDARSPWKAARRVTVRTVGGGFHYAPRSASVWDLQRCQSARALQHSGTSLSATSTGAALRDLTAAGWTSTCWVGA
jgi:hypothetical protein